MKKNSLIVTLLLVIGIVSITVGVTYAFFNYTRTGLANTLSTGTINFTSSQDGRINLTNIFPINPEETGIMNDATKVGTVAITVTGDTSYDKGVEYLISAVNVNNTVGAKHIPISISATASGTLGTSDEDYFENRDTASSHIYKVLAKDTISEGDQLMVGYIAKNATGINGTMTIKAYIDKNKIAITDTPDENSEWQQGREIFTTTEWNSMQGTGVSFQVRVEANEGVWVEEQLSRNDMVNINSVFTSEQKSNITEINFIKVSETEINSHSNLIDLTVDGGSGVVKAWIENNKLYIASPGGTYFPVNSIALLGGFSNVTSINFGNVNTSEVENMTALFNGNASLTDIDIKSFDTGSVTNMQAMFGGCSNIGSINLNSLDTHNVTNMINMFSGCSSLTIADLSGLGGNNLSLASGMFSGCSSLTEINMSNFNFGTISEWGGIFNLSSSINTINLMNANTSRVTNMYRMFINSTSLVNIDLTGIDTSNVTNMQNIFNGCTSLETIYVSNTWDIRSVSNSSGMFTGCTSLKGGGNPQTTYDANHTDKEYARIDGGANSATPGYLTLKTN